MPRNFAFSKVNVGNGVKDKSKFDLSNSLCSTMSFGDVQPLICKLMMPGSTLKGNLDSKIRVMPMPLPPFGKCAFHQYAQFVGVSDLWRAFPNFFSAQTLSTSHRRYIPTEWPRLPIWGPVSLFSQLVADKMCVYTVLGYTDYTGPDTSKGQSAFAATITGLYGSNVGNKGNIGTAALNSLCGFETYEDSVVARAALASSTYNGFGRVNRADSGNPYDSVPSGDIATALKKGLSFKVEDSDFSLWFDGEEVSSVSPTSMADGDDGIVVVIRLTAQGRAFVRALASLGITLTPNDSQGVDMLALFAYYKVWFDIFYPKRDLQWTDTRVYQILDYISESGRSLASFDDLHTMFTSNDESGDMETEIQCLHQALLNITDMWATCDPNYITSAVRNVSSELSTDNIEAETGSMHMIETTTGNLLSDALPESVNSGDRINRVVLQMANVLGKFVNVNTVIGRNIDAYFKAHVNGYTGLAQDSKFAGASVTDIQLGDTIVTASTDDAKAGDFAGVGFGAGGFKIKYTAREYGYYIIIGAVIPVANYVQTTEYDRYVGDRFRVPQPEFDALGMECVKKSEVSNSPIRCNSYIRQYGHEVFGYQPRYTGHKVMKSRLSGELAFASSRDQWLGFTLDNVQSNGLVVSGGVEGEDSSVTVVQFDGDMLEAGTTWRWLGRYPWLGNQRRIFYDNNLVSDAKINDPIFFVKQGGAVFYSGTAPVSDGFVLYCDFSLDYIAPMRSISQSYDTLDGANYVDHE